MEAANSGLKTGSLSLSISIKMHTLAGTQLKVGEKQTMKTQVSNLIYVIYFLC